MSLSNIRIGMRLIASFGLFIAFLAAFGIYTLNTINEISGLTTRLHRNPHTVIAAALEVNTAMVAINRSMKDVALAKTPQQIDAAVAAVDKSDAEAIAHLALLEERFLGDKTEIQKLREAIVAWRPIRADVIALSREGRAAEAAEIVRVKGSAAVKSITGLSNVIIAAAKETAQTFVENAESRAAAASAITIGLLSWA